MVVEWDKELPEKRQKGVKYIRPNGEPVMWPGEFGYDNDYSLHQWSLEEESAAKGIDEYDNKEATDALGNHLDLLSPGGLKLALELDKYKRENEVDNIDNTSADSM
jgi:hypothetical protein